MTKHIRDFPSNDLNLVAFAYVYDEPDAHSASGFERRVEMEVRDQAAYDRYDAKGAVNGEYRSRCDCCGHGLSYSCVVEHTPTGEFYLIGRDCFANVECLQQHAKWVSLTGDRAVARVAAANKAVKERRAGDVREGKYAEERPDIAALLDWAKNPPFAADHPSYQCISYAVSVWGDFRSTVRRYGKLSDKQIAFGVKLHAEAVAKLAEDEARAAAILAAKAAGLRAPQGRCEVTGIVVATKVIEDDFYGSTKCLVDFGNGTRAWGTFPSSATGGKGDKVRFRASFEVSAKDSLFAFFKRPSNWTVLQEAA
jgi:hypothetical protein